MSFCLDNEKKLWPKTFCNSYDRPSVVGFLLDDVNLGQNMSHLRYFEDQNIQELSNHIDDS